MCLDLRNTQDEKICEKTIDGEIGAKCSSDLIENSYFLQRINQNNLCCLNHLYKIWDYLRISSNIKEKCDYDDNELNDCNMEIILKSLITAKDNKTFEDQDEYYFGNAHPIEANYWRIVIAI